MAQYNINSATASDLTNAVKDYEVTPMQTDGVSNQDETWWVNPNWNWQWGYFNTNAEKTRCSSVGYGLKEEGLGC